jgi:hypothetical protein
MGQCWAFTQREMIGEAAAGLWSAACCQLSLLFLACQLLKTNGQLISMSSSSLPPPFWRHAMPHFPRRARLGDRHSAQHAQRCWAGRNAMI